MEYVNECLESLRNLLRFGEVILHMYIMTVYRKLRGYFHENFIIIQHI